MAEAIYSSETAPAPRTRNLPARRVQNVGGGRAPRTEYVLVTPKGSQRTPGYSVRYTGRGPQRGKIKGIPGFLQNRPIILAAWLGVMIIVSLDEWKAYGILPRPMRLWYTSMLYFILAGLAAIDILAPLASLLAVAFFITVLYQYLTATGQFSNGKQAMPSAGQAVAGIGTIGGAAAEGGAGLVNSIVNAGKTVGNGVAVVGSNVTRGFGPGQKTAGGQ